MASPQDLLHRANADPSDSVSSINSLSTTDEMSYADMAKKGPKQAPEDKMPDAVPEIAHSDSGVHSLDSSSSDHIGVGRGSGGQAQIPSYADQQKEAEEAERKVEQGAQEAKRAAKETTDQASKDAKDFMNRAEKSANKLESQGAKKYQQFTQDAKEEWDKLSKEAQKHYNDFAKEADKDAKKAEKKGKEAEDWAEKNKGNPVVIGNVAVIGALATLLGVQGYRMHQAGTLTWKVAGAWAGAVGLFAVGDYYVSQWFFKNKYPPKQ